MFIPHPAFGEGIQSSPIFDELRALPKRLCSTDLQIVLRTRYEEHFGIVNHTAVANDPSQKAFSLVMLNESEDIYGYDIQRDRAMKFATYRVPHYFHIGYDGFIQLPKPTCDMIFELCEKLIAKEQPTIAAWQGLQKELDFGK